MSLKCGRLALLAATLLVVTACGGGGSNGGNNGGGQTMVTVSGTVSYEYVPARINCAGLDFGATETRPIRGATVQLLNAGSGAQMASMVSSVNGAYSFANVPANTSVRVRVRAELKQAGAAGWDVEVRDNYIAGASDFDNPAPPALGTRALYTLDGTSFNTGSRNVTRSLTATTGWGANSYTGTRAAAPFAMLDTIYTMIQFVRATDASADFAPLDAFWSVNNTFATNGIDLTAGQLSTTSYYPSFGMMFVLGDDTRDTDEFDEHIIGHEWGHYFEDVFSRSDSPGGSHSLGESLDATLAFGEGWGYVIAAMALDDPLYCDTGVPGTAGGFQVSAENTIFGVQGWFNEVSVLTFMYDLWDDNDDGTDNDSIGFGPIYDVMTGPQVLTEGFTTLFSFATELRASLDAQGQALVDSQLDRMNVVWGADLDIWATNETNDANAPDVLPLYTPYTADGSILNICVNSSLDGLDRDGNNPGEDRYLRITIPADDEYDVRVVTTTPTPPSADPNDRDQSDPDIYIMRGALPGFIAEGTQDVTLENGFFVEPTFRTPILFAAETYSAIVEEWRFDDPETSTTYPQRICFDVSFTPTP